MILSQEVLEMSFKSFQTRLNMTRYVSESSCPKFWCQRLNLASVTPPVCMFYLHRHVPFICWSWRPQCSWNYSIYSICEKWFNIHHLCSTVYDNSGRTLSSFPVMFPFLKHTAMICNCSFFFLNFPLHFF